MKSSVKIISFAVIAFLYSAIFASATVLIVNGFIAYGVASILGVLLASLITYYAVHITRKHEYDKSLNARIVIIPDAHTTMILTDKDIVNIANAQPNTLFMNKDDVVIDSNGISFRE